MKTLILLVLAGCLTAVLCQSRRDHRERYRYDDDDFMDHYDMYDRHDPYSRRDNRPQRTGFSKPIPRERDELGAEKGYEPIANFSLTLFKASNTLPNFILSPLTPQILLSYLTWTADGNTYKELTNAIGYGSPTTMQKLTRSLTRTGGNREIELATAFFHAPDMKLNEEFVYKSYRSADIVPVDFAKPVEAAKAIKKWSGEKMKGQLKLNDVSFDPSTKLALQSALYFKGKFYFTFNASLPGDFFPVKGGPAQSVQMMTMDKKFRWGKINDTTETPFAEWAAIPYMSDDSLLIILPNKDVDIDDAINRLTDDNMNVILENLGRDRFRAKVNFTMPKFKLQSTMSLVEPLKKMGVKSLFTSNAELPYLANNGNIQVSSAQQQASLDVSEKGSIMLAVTNFNIAALSLEPVIPKVNFMVDRPFIAIIVNNEVKIPYVFAKITDPVY